MEPPQDPSAGSPRMPSFASLRGPARRSPVDVLLPGNQPVAPQPVAPQPVAPQPVAPNPARPPEWADLLHLAVHLAGVAVAAPVRWARRVLGA